MAKIHLSNLAHCYDDTPKHDSEFALKPMNHTWEDGKAYALLGPSGCGKTTLLNIISGLVKPSHGQVLFDDNDVTNSSTAERNIAQVFQFPVVYDTMSVYDNLAFPIRNRGFDEKYVDKRVHEVAQMIGIKNQLHIKAKRLTADFKQKISLGRGIVREDVNAILFDEPLTVIDPHMKWALRTQLKKLHYKLKHTMIYVTHDQVEALTFADKVVVMDDGVVLQIGTPEHLFERPNHTFVGYFIGSPGMNFFKATVFHNVAVVSGYEVALNKSYKNIQQNVKIGVRPEHITLSDRSGLPIIINHIEDLGRYQLVRATFAGSDVNITVPYDMGIENKPYYINFDMQYTHIYKNEWLVEGTDTT